MKNNSFNCIACHNETMLFCKLTKKFDTSNTLSDGEYIKYNFCPKCLTIQQDSIPTKKMLSNLIINKYSKGLNTITYNIQQTDSLKNQHEKIIDILKSYKIKNHVLDVGAGVGSLCSLLLNNKVKCEGIDLSPELVAFAKKKGLPINQRDLFSINSYSSYSAIVMSHVFEHLPNPDCVLSHIHKLLEPKGVFVTVQPTASISHFFFENFTFKQLQV